MFPVLAGNSASTSYNLTRSLRFRSSASAYLNRTPASTSNQKTWTWSGWIKRGILGQSAGSTPYFFASSSAGSDTYFFACGFNGDNLVVTGYATNYLTTTAVYRDPASWYHVVIAVDTTQATTSNRIKVYVNGSQVTAFSTANYVAQNFNTPVNLNQAHYHCAFNVGSGVTNFNDLYLEEVNLIDGQALTPSSFGSTNALTGVWQPARYSGTYGTNGFYLPFTDNSALTTSSNVGLGKDFSGNGNYWTTNNISITSGVTYDSMTDVPTLTSATAANFAVLNAVTPNSFTLTNGNLSAFKPNVASQTYNSRSTISVNSGKWYAEFTVVGSITGVGAPMIGITNPANSSNSALANFADTFLYYGYNGFLYNNGTGAAYGATFGANDVIGIALNLDAGTLTFYKNNVSQGVATSSIAGKTFVFLVNDDQGLNSWTVAVNYGQQPFTYTPPTGYVALNTYNLPTPTISAGNTVMDATLYSGTGANQNIVNAAGFKPDFVWGKLRNGADQNFLVNSVAGATNYLVSNSTQQETADATTVVSLNSNGFTVGTSTNLNRSGGYNFVGWQWQAGQGTTSSNTSGSITSTVSVNASAGFSVVTYTAQSSGTGTVGHGLGVAPSLVITKPRVSPYGWTSYHASLGNTQYIELNSTNAASTLSTAWNNTSPTSSVFTLGSAFAGNGTYVAYCFAQIAGYSAMGSYLGNGSTSGPFVYCGFQPKFILIKSTTSARDWIIWDTVRNTFNIGTAGVLFPDTSGAEYSGSGAYSVAVTSNGFYLPVATTNLNASGETHIYAAFSSYPFKYSNAF